MAIDPALLTVHVRTRREAQKLRLIDVATRVGFSRSKLARIELGTTDLAVQDLALLARTLEVNPWDLVTFVGYALPCGCCQRAAPAEDTP
jgi:transcriptional regulator with XRE-family HTH domain